MAVATSMTGQRVPGRTDLRKSIVATDDPNPGRSRPLARRTAPRRTVPGYAPGRPALGGDAMTRRTRSLILGSTLIVMVLLASACEIDFPQTVDCSGINQPDNGGLVCLGLNVIGLVGGLAAILIALLVGLGAPAPY